MRIFSKPEEEGFAIKVENLILLSFLQMEGDYAILISLVTKSEKGPLSMMGGSVKFYMLFMTWVVISLGILIQLKISLIL